MLLVRWWFNLGWWHRYRWIYADYQMNCWHCETELIWGGDHDMDGEDYPLRSGEYSMVTNLSCPKCNSFVEVYLPRDAYD